MADAPSRREEILQTLAVMLEEEGDSRITTAALARHVGVSEAALYRHFPSKTRMYEELLEFTEQTLFSRTRTIGAEIEDTPAACGQMLLMMLTFAERNPGITRLLCGDALHGEKDRVRHRAGQVFDRLESELKQTIRVGEVRDGIQLQLPLNAAVALMMALAEGRLRQFLRSRFERSPTADWSRHWDLVTASLFRR